MGALLKNGIYIGFTKSNRGLSSGSDLAYTKQLTKRPPLRARPYTPVTNNPSNRGESTNCSPSLKNLFRAGVIQTQELAPCRIHKPPPVYKNISLALRVYPAITGSSKINSRLTGGSFEWADEGPLYREHTHILGMKISSP